MQANIYHVNIAKIYAIYNMYETVKKNVVKVVLYYFLFLCLDMC